MRRSRELPEGEPYCDIPICHVPGTIRHCLARAWHGLARSGSEQEAATLLAAGNEFANHLTADRSGHYHKLAPDALRVELQEATNAIYALGQSSVNWFRAPQGRLTSSMRAVVVDEGMRHALGDAYCDDWCISDHNFVANTLLRQVWASPAATRPCMQALCARVRARRCRTDRSSSCNAAPAHAKEYEGPASSSFNRLSNPFNRL